jgi:RNA polymerase primary sigma factor
MSMRQLKITKSITNRESQSLEKYLQEIGKVELITPEEEVKLAIKIKQGCQVSLERLIFVLLYRLPSNIKTRV